MRFKIKTVKKGLTLIEILISLTILSIVAIPISNLVLTSVKINKNSEDKQKSVTIAQQIIEELKAVPKLENSMMLSNGIILTSIEGTDNGFKGAKALEGGFKAEVSIKPKTSLKAEAETVTSNTYDAELSIKQSDDNGVYIRFKGDLADEKIKWNSLRFDNTADKIAVTAENTAGGFIIKNYARTEASLGSIRVQISEGANSTQNKVLDLKAYNSLSSYFTVYVEKNSKATIEYSFENLGGNIRRYNNTVYSASKESMNGTYEIEVSILKKDSIIYSAKAFKTMY